MADVFDFYVYDDRSIKFAIAEPIMLEDKDVTQFRFRIPKVLNNIDMSSWEWWFIFVNAKKVKYTTQLTLTDDEDEPENYSVATYTVGYGFSGYVGSVSFSIEALNVSGEDIVNEWHTRTYNTHVIDTLQGTRAVIPEPEADAGTGLTAEEKSLILELFSKAAYAEDDAGTAYDALEAMWTTTTRSVSYSLTHVTSSNTSASVESGQSYTTTLTADTNYTLNSVSVTMGGVDITSTAYSSGTITIPSVTGNIVITATAVLAAQSITATYTQSGTVYDTDSLDSLKADLVVTANYAGGTSETVPASDYTLSGTLTVGTSTVTVNYSGLTTTFNVTVSEFGPPSDYTAHDYLAYKGGTGTRGIITPAQMKSEYTIEFDMYLPAQGGAYGSVSPVFGTRIGGGGTKEFAIFATGSSGKIGYWYNGTDTSTNIVVTREVVHHYKILPVGASTEYPLNAVIDIDGTEYSTGSTASGVTWSEWFGIMGYGTSASTVSASGNTYYQLGDIVVKNANGDTIYWFMPVSKGTQLGFYDVIGQAFYEADSAVYQTGDWT